MLLRRSVPLLVLLGCSSPMMPPPVCTASTCAGCCDGRGQCQDGASAAACGRLGLTCAVCVGGQACVAGLCQGAIGGGNATVGGGTSGGESDGGMGGGAAGGASAGGATAGGASDGGMVARRFASTPLRFAVPGVAYNAASAMGRGLKWNTLDLSGDGRVDLVVTSDTLGAPLLGGTTLIWNVFAGGPSGFATLATAFQVPGPTTPPLAQTDSATGQLFWNTLDVTGDGFPDFVHTMNPTTPGSPPFFPNVSSTTDGWLVRQGGRGGFSAMQTTFTVPLLTGRIERTFADLQGKRWALANLNGDRIPDLVISADPQTDAVWLSAVGGPEWVVCIGSATGFGELGRCARTPVPVSGSPLGFRSTTSSVAGQVWRLTDLNGDGLDDLVQTTNPSTSGAAFGNANGAFWRVWLGQPNTSFAATPTPWPVPALSYATPESTGAPQLWSLVDLDGDGMKDLVLTTEPNTGRPFGTLAAPSWNVHLGTSRGFSPTATVWPIPPGPGVDGFRATRGPTWGLLDLTFDGVPDLVEFADPNLLRAFSDAQGAFWRVYPATP